MPDQPLGKSHIFQEPDKPYRIHLLRLALENHLHLSEMADTKANIIIGISTVVFSLLLPQIQSQGFVLHLISLSITAAFSAFTGILSVIPRTKGLLTFFWPFNKKKASTFKFNPLFFAAFINMPEEEYVDYMFDNVLQEESDVYEAILIDLHRLGKILDRKYKYLSYGYFIFATGLFISAILLLIDLFFQ
ncbi:MAG: hypothetical protein HC799_14215 [Limnothrix sp. RL_2_0]|nr:hypothetical protein [Limnothrix sp. RL_2_0]